MLYQRLESESPHGDWAIMLKNLRNLARGVRNELRLPALPRPNAARTEGRHA